MAKKAFLLGLFQSKARRDRKTVEDLLEKLLMIQLSTYRAKL